jgi:hypothetical protein
MIEFESCLVRMTTENRAQGIGAGAESICYSRNAWMFPSPDPGMSPGFLFGATQQNFGGHQCPANYT